MEYYKIDYEKREPIIVEILRTLVVIVIGVGIVFGVGLTTKWVVEKDRGYHRSYSLAATYRVTAYCPCEKCCGIHSDGITASGYRIKYGDKFCASPKKFLTILNIPGYGVVPVLDRGGAIKEGCIDVYFDTHQEALNWGVQYLEVKEMR